MNGVRRDTWTRRLVARSRVYVALIGKPAVAAPTAQAVVQAVAGSSPVAHHSEVPANRTPSGSRLVETCSNIACELLDVIGWGGTLRSQRRG